MALQQKIVASVTLVGDGAATTFTYSISKLPGLSVGSFAVGNLLTLPTSVTYDGTNSDVPGSASIDGFGNLIITLNSALANGAVANITVDLLYNSGTLQGTTAAWTSATALNTTWTLPLNGSNSCSVGFVMSGTVSSGTILFEVSQDGGAWLPIQGAIADGYTNLTGWTPGVGSRAISFDVAGYAYLRLRLNPVITGTGTVTFIFQATNYVTEPVPTVGQSNGSFLHTTLDDAAGGNAVNSVVKGTQAARALGVQNLKDSGRTSVTLSAQGAAGVIAEAMLSMGQNKGGTVTAGVTSYTITSGKTLRIQNISYSVRSGAAAVPFSRITLRSNTAGATIATSAILVQLPEVTGPAATIGVGGNESVDFPDGLEIAGNGTISIGLSHLDQATTNVINVTLTGYEY
jgi:hypothetical protein